MPSQRFPRRVLPAPPCDFNLNTDPSRLGVVFPPGLNRRDGAPKRKHYPSHSPPCPRRLPPCPQGLAPAPRYHNNHNNSNNRPKNYNRQNRPRSFALSSPQKPNLYQDRPKFDPFGDDNGMGYIAPLTPSKKVNHRANHFSPQQPIFIPLPVTEPEPAPVVSIDISEEESMIFAPLPDPPQPLPVAVAAPPAPTPEPEPQPQVTELPKKFLKPEDVWPRLLAMVLLEKSCMGRSKRSGRKLGYVPSSLSQVVYLADD